MYQCEFPFPSPLGDIRETKLDQTPVFQGASILVEKVDHKHVNKRTI